jgi:hypothetical protein
MAVGACGSGGEGLVVQGHREWQGDGDTTVIAVDADVGRAWHEGAGACGKIVGTDGRHGLLHLSRSGGRWHSLRSRRCGIKTCIWFGCRLGHGAFCSVPLRQREWDRADGHKQKQIKCASEKMRFDGRVNLLFHFTVVLVRILICSSAKLYFRASHLF